MLTRFCILTVVMLLTGCTSITPKMAQDCEIAPYKQIWEEKGKTVDDCKLASEKAEDFRYYKKLRKQQDEANARHCWECCRQAYDTWSQRCKSWDML